MHLRTLDTFRFSISTQIAAIFCVINFIIVICFSILVTTLLRTVVLNQKSDELLQNSKYIVRELENPVVQNELLENVNEMLEGGLLFRQKQQDSFDLVDRLARQVRLPYYISYSVFIIDGEYAVYLGTNDPYIPILSITEEAEPKRVIQRNYYSDGDLNILYVTLPAGKLYVQTSLNMEVDSIDKLLAKLPIIILILLIPLLVISFFAARFISGQMLKPVAEITQTAKEISASNLDRRIPESNAKDEIHELARTFNSLFARLQSDFNRERQFTSDVSHELRTPLAVLSGHIDLLRRWGKDDKQVLESSLETLFLETKSMKQLVENLLLLSRSERKAQPVEKVYIKLYSLLKKVVEDIKIVNPEVLCEIKCSESVRLFVDPNVLTQILRILISNSISYSNSPAHIHFIFNERKNELVIKDEGFGIQEKDISHIFERLYRADESRNHKTGGNGLGLAIAKTLVCNLDASIRAESEGENKGTSMIITFKKE